ncbi:MAG: hypothetical protein AB1540_11455 [Bdellovibrionota bacterium]
MRWLLLALLMAPQTDVSADEVKSNSRPMYRFLCRLSCGDDSAVLGEWIGAVREMAGRRSFSNSFSFDDYKMSIQSEDLKGCRWNGSFEVKFDAQTSRQVATLTRADGGVEHVHRAPALPDLNYTGGGYESAAWNLKLECRFIDIGEFSEISEIDWKEYADAVPLVPSSLRETESREGERQDEKSAVRKPADGTILRGGFYPEPTTFGLDPE